MSRAFVSEADRKRDQAQRGAGPEIAGLGTRVTIRRGVVVTDVRIVAEEEADPAHGRIAWSTPLALALQGARKGDVIELEAGERVEEVRILAVRAGNG